MAPRYWDPLIGLFQIFIRLFCSPSPSLRPPTMPSISMLSSCGLAVARLCYFVSMWLRSFSSLSLLDNGTNALAFVPGAGVRGMKEAQAECSIHPNTHLWQTPGPYDSPREQRLHYWWPRGWNSFIKLTYVHNNAQTSWGSASGYPHHMIMKLQ